MNIFAEIARRHPPRREGASSEVPFACGELGACVISGSAISGTDGAHTIAILEVACTIVGCGFGDYDGLLTRDFINAAWR